MNTTIIKMVLIAIATVPVVKAIQDASYIPFASTITPAALAAIPFGKGSTLDDEKKEDEDK
ncbi:hypothetical protein [Nostoc parmelioides]|uniref:TMhelix containing protein n=1 Tax=Nostoc parmelioides FACHB-3921 TaxID=2692909 RepID=A0ABR8BB09_9NOSO|nr:hypothetical protein [Nostoc parmelioides]MBD2251031.1 hypothetical protein [Nostoc parmelioides FACHB-3921]